MSSLFETLESRRLLSGDTFVAQFDELISGEMTGGEVAAVMAEAGVDDVYARTSWNGENYWFQTSDGDVYALWHGGSVHDADDDGRFQWNLTNITDAAGVPAGLRTGSLSATFTPWRAMNIVGLNEDGRVVTYWWSPEAGERGFGARGNGWCLTDLQGEADFGEIDDDRRGDDMSRAGVTVTRMAGPDGRTIEIIVDDDAGDDRVIVIAFTPGHSSDDGLPWIARFVNHRDLRDGDGDDGRVIIGDATIAEGVTVERNIRIINGTLTVLGVVEGNIRQSGAGSVIVDGGLVKGNIHEQDEGDITITAGGLVEGNAIERDAGDLVIDGGSTLKGNALEHDAGQVRIEADSLVEGNAIERDEGDIIVADGSTLKGNAIERDAGGVRIESGSLVEGNAIEGDEGDITVTDSELKGNAEERDAGGITITGSLVDGNLLERDAGSIAVLGDSLIKGNVYEYGRGTASIDDEATVEGDVEEEFDDE